MEPGLESDELKSCENQKLFARRKRLLAVGVYTLGNIDCKSKVNINLEVSKNWSKLFFDIDCKVTIIAVKNTY